VRTSSGVWGCVLSFLLQPRWFVPLGCEAVLIGCVVNGFCQRCTVWLCGSAHPGPSQSLCTSPQ
jgi:hypothetical protein